MSVCLSIWKRNCNLVPLPSLSWFCFFQTLFLVSEQVIKKSILLAHFRNSGKMNFYIRDWWSSIFIVREPCQGPARPPPSPPPPPPLPPPPPPIVNDRSLMGRHCHTQLNMQKVIKNNITISSMSVNFLIRCSVSSQINRESSEVKTYSNDP